MREPRVPGKESNRSNEVLAVPCREAWRWGGCCLRLAIRCRASLPDSTAHEIWAATRHVHA